MKRNAVCFLILCLVLVGCGGDGSNGVDIPATDDDAGNNPPSNEVGLELVDAFPNQSFSEPVDFQALDDGSNRIFVVEKGGSIQVFENTPQIQQASEFLNLPGISTGSELGLLGLAFHPDFSNNRFFFVYYTPTSSSSRISRFTAGQNGGLTNNATEVVLLEFPQPFTNHNGGQLAFGSEGYLYISSGDGGSGGDPDNNAQTNSNLLGTILRIDVDNTQGNLNYSIPSDNPFVGNPNARGEIFAYGLRNPWRMSFDTETGMLWTGDVGQNRVEEVDVIVNGGNYGWRLFEGSSCFSGECNTTGLVAPFFEYTQENGDRSITGGYVYRGAENTSLLGKYIYGDFVSGRIWALDADGNNEFLLDSSLQITCFGTDANEELYVCDFGGRVYRLVETE